MSNRRYDLTKPEDIEELRRLALAEGDDFEGETVAEDDFRESDESDSPDEVETRSVDSDTDHEITEEEDVEDEGGSPQNYFLGKSV